MDISLVNNHLAYDDEGIRVSMASQTIDDVSSDLDGYDKSNVTTHALKINYDLTETSHIESISTYRLFKMDVAIDFNFTNDPDLAAHWFGKRKAKTLAQEIRYHDSLLDDRLSVLLGVYADKRDEDRFNTEEFLDKSLGVFCHAKYQINDQFNVLSGIRYDREEKEYINGYEGIDSD